MSSVEDKVRGWIENNSKENSRLEFKKLIPLDKAGAKAEFIRDVIALANSEGEFPRAEGYLVIGCKDGKRYDVAAHKYDGAKFGQLLDSLVHPAISAEYIEFGTEVRVGVLVIKGSVDALHVVSKRLLDENEKALLWPGQSWGRVSDRKIELDGVAISSRHRAILERRIAESVAPFQARIHKLESNAGPAFEVKRLRFAIEATQDWTAVDDLLAQLGPYVREFDHAVKHEVMDAVLEVTARTHRGMPVWVARSVDSLLGEMMPSVAGGMQRKSSKEISQEDRELMKRAEYANFQITWDACRYLRDLSIVEVGAQRYWCFIRFTTLNHLQPLQKECLENACYCLKICEEMREGKPFAEAQRKLQEVIKDALDITDQ